MRKRLAPTGIDSAITKPRKVFAHEEKNKKSCTKGFSPWERSDVCLLSIGGSRCSVADFAVTNLVRFTSIV